MYGVVESDPPYLGSSEFHSGGQGVEFTFLLEFLGEGMCPGIAPLPLLTYCRRAKWCTTGPDRWVSAAVERPADSWISTCRWVLPSGLHALSGWACL